MDLRKINRAEHEYISKEIAAHFKMRHPRIVKILDHKLADHFVYILLEHVENGTLYSFQFDKFPLQVSFIRKIVAQVAQAIEHVHSHGYIHRDVKPENILLDQHLDAKLCDFGLCVEQDNEAERRQRVGTYEYMSPEALNKQLQGREVDVWALGVLLFEMFHNRPPFPGTSAAAVQSSLSQGLRIDAHVPPLAKDLIEKLLVASPQQRLTLAGLLAHEFITSGSNVDASENPRTSNQASSSQTGSPDLQNASLQPIVIQSGPRSVHSGYSSPLNSLPNNVSYTVNVSVGSHASQSHKSLSPERVLLPTGPGVLRDIPPNHSLYSPILRPHIPEKPVFSIHPIKATIPSTPFKKPPLAPMASENRLNTSIEKRLLNVQVSGSSSPMHQQLSRQNTVDAVASHRNLEFSGSTYALDSPTKQPSRLADEQVASSPFDQLTSQIRRTFNFEHPAGLPAHNPIPAVAQTYYLPPDPHKIVLRQSTFVPGHRYPQLTQTRTRPASQLHRPLSAAPPRLGQTRPPPRLPLRPPALPARSQAVAAGPGCRPAELDPAEQERASHPAHRPHHLEQPQLPVQQHAVAHHHPLPWPQQHHATRAAARSAHEPDITNHLLLSNPPLLSPRSTRSISAADRRLESLLTRGESRGS